VKRVPLSLGLLAALVLPVRAGLMNELSSADQARVKAGDQVMVTEAVDGYPWPRARIYQRVNATPRQVMAVFFDYDNAHTFVPNCTKSRIARELDARTFDVDYVVSVPVLPSECYTARNELSSSEDGVLKVKWEVLHATSIKESRGNLVVEPLGAEESIICYTNLVKPGVCGAGLIKGIAMGQMKDTVNAIVGRVVERKRNPQALAPEMDRLASALGETNLIEAKK
jgi:hypothetical protein